MVYSCTSIKLVDLPEKWSNGSSRGCDILTFKMDLSLIKDINRSLTVDTFFFWFSVRFATADRCIIRDQVSCFNYIPHSEVTSR